ncbi:MAG: hypothetical protein KGJ08_03235 [Gammaproteobacteria bacterium]|nr:hypothetical protein [Gammaproteobacteria bacterium]
MFAKILKMGLLIGILSITGCATTTEFQINHANWPSPPPDEINVRPSLRQLLHDHPTLKVVLRVPNVTTNVTQSQGGQNAGAAEALMNNAYDDIEKRLFNAGFVVRDRALLSNLINEKGITSYKEIQSRVDTDLIIDVSSLQFNQPENWLFTNSYTTQDGAVNQTDKSETMGEAVAYVEAKFIIVESGEVGGIVTLHVPICESVHCSYYSYFFDDGMGDTNSSFDADSKEAGYATVKDQNSGATVYLWGTGNGPGSINSAADLIAQKIVSALRQ